MRPWCLLAGSFVLACSSSSSAPTPSQDGGGGTAATTGDGGGHPDSGGATDGGADARPGVDAGPCGLTFYANDYEPAWQLILDKYCCEKEKACGADTACATLVKCINDCVPPRDQACVDACGAREALLGAISTCTKTPPYTVPTGINCDWPQ
jgi:hypothetical protein